VSELLGYYPIIPFGGQIVKQDGQIGFEFLYSLAADIVGAANDVDRYLQPGPGRGATHQLNHRLQRVEYRADFRPNIRGDVNRLC